MCKISLWLIVFIVIILSNCPPIVSEVINQDPPSRQIRVSPKEPRPEKKVEPSQEKKMPTERIKKKGGPQKIELNFEGAPLTEVIRVILGDYLNKNYTVQPNLNPGLTLFIRGKYTDTELSISYARP